MQLRMNDKMGGRIAAVGMFDGVHTGHRHLIAHLRELAARYGQQPMVVTFSNHPLEIIAPQRAPELLSSPDEKRQMLLQQQVEVEMLEFDNGLRCTSTVDFLEMLRRRYNVGRLLLGFNNRFGHDAPTDFVEFRKLASGRGIDIELSSELTIPGMQSVSSSEIRRLIGDRHIADANLLLGREYAVRGKVAHGKAIGRTIGFPTANVVPDFNRKVVPPRGVYAARAVIDGGDTFPAMVNIGSRPTINADDSISTIEANLIGFSGDLYDRCVTLRFVEYLRGELRFSGLDELRMQIEADRTMVLAMVQ